MDAGCLCPEGALVLLDAVLKKSIMNALNCTSEITCTRKGLWKIYHGPEVDASQVLDAIDGGGEVLKESKKGRVHRISSWVVKMAGGGFGGRLIRLSFKKARYRRGWVASHHLQSHQVGCPEPIAYAEKGIAGLVFQHALVSDYLEEERNIEVFARALIQRGGSQDTLSFYLSKLAMAVNALNASGAYHGDLSGKNIFTRDGESFRFIDLDSVVLGEEYVEVKRLKNHVQLYDSFCDEMSDALLVPFIQAMLPSSIDPRVWMPQVRDAQEKRRHRTEEKWAKQGRWGSSG